MINILHDIKISKNVKLRRVGSELQVENLSGKPGYIYFIKPKKITKPFLRIKFNGILNYGKSPNLLIVNLKKQLRGKISFNTECYHPQNTSAAIFVIKIHPKSNVIIDNISYELTEMNDIVDLNDYQGDYLVITPMYPTIENKYSATFVYSKVKEYLLQGLKIDVAVCSADFSSPLYKYSIDGQNITKMSYNDLRNVIQSNKYKKILLHFIDAEFARVLDACNLEETEIYIYCHGADVDLYNPNIFSKYFVADHNFTENEIKYRKERQVVLKKYNDLPNVKWIFNTKWNLENARKVNDLKFKNKEIIPCVIDQETFKYTKRNPELRKKILILKRMDDIRQYAVDIAVRTILELSKRPFFAELEFLITGDGDSFDRLVSPVKKFDNVKIIRGFYNHQEMNELYHQYGILLVPSRYDTQGVIAGEAAMTGMVLVASKNTGMSSMLREDIGTFFDTTEYEQAADIIEYLYNNPKVFVQKSEEFRKTIEQTASKDMIKKEIKLLKSEYISKDVKSRLHINKINPKPILSIVVASFNVDKYLKKSIYSLILDNNNINDLEIIIVNDGSTDRTSEIAKELVDLTTVEGNSIVKLIDKKNGGHGSAINEGLSAAKGKYFKLMDGDDMLNTKFLEQHINTLRTTEADLILTDLVEDLAEYSIHRPNRRYEFMEPYKKYLFVDLCDEHYGFQSYGPVLSTTTVNTEKLRATNCRLDENSFYVDIQYNYYVSAAAETVIYEPLDLYLYYIGRSGQSISRASYMKNYLQHRNVLISLMELIDKPNFPFEKRSHLARIQVTEMIRHQYEICISYFSDKNMFKEFDSIMKKNPEFYNMEIYQSKTIKRLRKTNGKFFKTILFLSKYK